MTPHLIEHIARACHEVNRAWCLCNGDTSQVAWDDAPENLRASARAGVEVAVKGATPEQQHQAWCEFKLADGWTFGKIKDADAKTHPCLVPYDQLPAAQRAKDALYISTVRAFLTAAQASGAAGDQ